jgi:hypothetical protein
MTTGGIAGSVVTFAPGPIHYDTDPLNRAENLLVLLLGVIYPRSGYLTVCLFPMCKLYVNCLLAL